MKTPNHALDAQRKLNRRGFLWATATGLAGLAGVLALQQPPASAQERELTMLSFNNSVPQSDEELRRQATLFGQKHRVKAIVDTLSGLQIPQKLAAELGQRDGGWSDFCRDYSYVDGTWKALCWLWISLPGQYNKRQFDDAGLHAPDT